MSDAPCRGKILYLISLEDEYPDNRHRVHVLWEEAGASWLKDEVAKDKRIKDLADFPSEPPYHYPANGESLICLFQIIWKQRNMIDFS